MSQEELMAFCGMYASCDWIPDDRTKIIQDHLNHKARQLGFADWHDAYTSDQRDLDDPEYETDGDREIVNQALDVIKKYDIGYK